MTQSLVSKSGFMMSAEWGEEEEEG